MSNSWTLILGNNTITNCDAALIVEGEEVFRLRERPDDGQLLVDLDLRDQDGKRIARIEKNHPVFVAEGFTTDKRPGRYAVLRNGQPYASVVEVSSDTVKVTGTFNVKGLSVVVTDEATRIGGITFSGNTIIGFGTAIAISRDSFGIGLAE